MTANVLPEDRARAKQAGLDDHIPKPIDPQALYSKLLRWIKPGQRTPFEATSEAEPSAPELPQQLPGIAISDGMSRVGGNTKLYVKLLSDLRADYATAAETIEQLLQGMGEDAQLYPTVAAIRDAIDIYDFATASEQLAIARQGSVV